MKPPGASETDLANRVLGGRYRIEQRLGSGGMGHVFRATQLDLGRRVAVKILSDVPSQVDIARFEREARTAAGLGHPHIVQVTDFHAGASGTDPPFLVMELLEGMSLDALVRTSPPLPLERVVRIVLQVLSALGAAHSAGLVHRDVKPANIVLVASAAGDLAKVVDFGLAKEVEPSTTNPPVSRLGAIVGTPAFMAPEQARGERLDGRADLYGVAATLYFAITGRFPIEADPQNVLGSILMKEPTPISTHRSDVDARLAAIAMRGLEKDRARRFQSAAEMATDLERWLVAHRMSPTVSVGAATIRDEHVLGARSTPKNPRTLIFALVFGAVAFVALAVVALGVIAAAHLRSEEPAAAPDARRSAEADDASAALAATGKTAQPDGGAPARPKVPTTAAPPASSPPTTPPGGKTVGQPCASSTECAAANAVCLQGVCACGGFKGQYVACAGACVSLRDDPKNCGACGSACARDSLCSAGACQTCASYWKSESTAICSKPHVCVRISSDPKNCGACGKVCGEGDACFSGVCRPM